MPTSPPSFVLDANRVLRHLAEANVTQRDAAREAGLHPDHFGRLISGSHSPSARTRRRLMAAEVFQGLTFGDLFRQVGGDAT